MRIYLSLWLSSAIGHFGLKTFFLLQFSSIFSLEQLLVLGVLRTIIKRISLQTLSPSKLSEKDLTVRKNSFSFDPIGWIIGVKVQ